MHIDTAKTFNLKVEDLIGQRIAVLGISGSGKTNTAAVLIEELLSSGLPLTIVDIEGEYASLQEQFPLLVAGRSTHADVPLMVENAGAIATTSTQHGISIILELSDYDQDEMQLILLTYFEALWRQSSALKSPYEIVVEEAHEFIPQSVRTPLKTLLTRFALRGRKRGIGIILASQRSAKVEKDLLTQAGTLFLHSVVHPTDLSVYKDLIPLSGRDVEQQARELVPGEAFVVRGKQVNRIQVRYRHTFHAGATPALGTVPPSLKTIDAALLEELREASAQAAKGGRSDDLARLKRQLQESEALVAEQQTTIKRQAEQIELLSQLRVQGPTSLSIEQARVNHLHTPGPIPSVVSPSEPLRVIEATIATKEIAPPLNDAKFRSFQRRFHQVPALERAILHVLQEQQRALTAQQIAAWLNRSESTIQNNPPRTLLKLGLISRTRGKKGYLYQTQLDDYLEREFPGVEMASLLTQLFHSF